VQALYYNTTGNYNTASGGGALYSNTTGIQNSAVGVNALYYNTTGSYNSAVGVNALQNNTTGSNSVAIGYCSLYNSNATGNNIAVGFCAGAAITTGVNNVVIGSYTGSAAPISATGSNYIILADGAGNVRQVIDSSGNVGIGITSALTDKLQVNGSITGTVIKSTIATGTAPLTVTSTTPVTNLSIGGNAGTVTNGVYTTTAQTLTNKSLSDSTTFFIDETDATKKLQFQLSSITTATTRTLTVPDVSGTIITTGDTGTVTGTMIAAGTITDLDISSSAAITITKLASSTISGVSLGSNLNTLTISSPLTGTSYNGSAAVSIGIPAATTSASGYLTSTDWNTFNNKQPAGSYLTASTGVTTFSGGTTGLTPSTATSGAITLAGTLAIANGGTNSTATPTLGGAGYGTGTALAYTAVGTTGQVLTSQGGAAPIWATPSGGTPYTTASNVQLNSLGIGTPASATAGEIRATNTITAYYSDDRLKTKLGIIENAIEKIMSLDGFYYEANETAQELGYIVKREVGVSAQSVQKVLPEIVVPAPINDKYLTVYYDKLIPLLIQGFKEQQIQIDELRSLMGASK